MTIRRKGFIFTCILLTLMFVSSMPTFAVEDSIWITKASMFSSRHNYHEAVALNGKIYVIGGLNGGEDNSVEEYNPLTNSWTTKASMNRARINFKIVALNDKIYAIGGHSHGSLNTVEEYDPKKNTWTAKASLPTAREQFDVAVVNGKIYVVGGHINGACLQSVEEFNPTTNAWITKANMPTARFNHKIVVANEKLYAIGGNNGNYLNTVEEYNLATNTWSTMAKMTNARENLNLFVMNNKIYAIGGNTKSPSSAVEKFDLSTYTWTTNANMPTAISYYQADAINGKIYFTGGAEGSSSIKTVQEYNPITDTWIKLKEMSTARYQHKTAILDNKLYVIGGYSGASLNSLEEYTFGNTAPTTSSLTASNGNGKVVLSWKAVPDATCYNIKRALTAGGPYTTIATSSAITYTDTVKNKVQYYYVVSAVNELGEGKNSNEVIGLPANDKLNIDISSIDKTLIGDEITANIIIHNATNICAEDLKIAFDTNKLKFISCEAGDGIKIYKADNSIEGINRYITASLGKINAANGDKVLLKLTFKAIAPGNTKISVANARVADNSTLEKDLEIENCGEKSIFIQAAKDVDRTGDFTLLDLAIDAWYYGEAAENTDTSKYDADIILDGQIDDNDLTEIVNQILSNPNYPIK